MERVEKEKVVLVHELPNLEEVEGEWFPAGALV